MIFPNLSQPPPTIFRRAVVALPVLFLIVNSVSGLFQGSSPGTTSFPSHGGPGDCRRYYALTCERGLIRVRGGATGAFSASLRARKMR
jgi:hypothetical protein